MILTPRGRIVRVTVVSSSLTVIDEAAACAPPSGRSIPVMVGAVTNEIPLVHSLMCHLTRMA